MADCKKYNGSTWADTTLRQYKTATDTTTSLPADLYADGNNATVGLVGNMSQTGTPTPQNPIQPSECGERTGNLFDKDNTTIYNAYFAIGSESSIWLTNADSRSVKIPCKPNTQYTLSISSAISIFRICSSSNSNIEPSGGGVRVRTIIRSENKQQYTFTTSADDACILFQGTASLVNEWFNSLMLNEGATALPYEPYGIKIPISSANTTTPVYLGQVQTTRKIKKLVLTGEEVWDRQTPQHTNIINLYIAVDNAMSNSPIYSNIVTYFSDAGANNDSRANVGKANSTGVNLLLDLSLSDFSSTETFKTYLRQQYAAGTPVCVWYVLATEETGIVNEPIRKIGDYADTVSGITIPTTTGKDTFDVLTTLKPSEVELTYTGWHDASVGEWDGSQWQ